MTTSAALAILLLDTKSLGDPFMRLILLAAFAVVPLAAVAQPMPSVTTTASTGVALPPNTMIVVTPVVEITSKKMKEGDKVAFQVASDVLHNGVVIISRGAPLQSTITWRTGKGIGGKSAKFEVRFDSVAAGGREWKLRGTHRQEGRGNTAAALLGSIFISGRSAIMVPGQLINVFTAEPITN